MHKAEPERFYTAYDIYRLKLLPGKKKYGTFLSKIDVYNLLSMKNSPLHSEEISMRSNGRAAMRLVRGQDIINYLEKFHKEFYRHWYLDHKSS